MFFVLFFIFYVVVSLWFEGEIIFNGLIYGLERCDGCGKLFIIMVVFYV